METPKLNLLARAMRTYQWRLQAVTSNVANLDTPGYQRLSVSFEDKLQEARHTIPGAQRLKEIQPSMTIEETPPILEDELMEMADTQMRVQLATRALRDHFDTMRTGITGRAG